MSFMQESRNAGDRIRSLMQLSPLAGIAPPGMFGIPLLGAGLTPMIQRVSPGAAQDLYPHLREKQQQQQQQLASANKTGTYMTDIDMPGIDMVMEKAPREMRPLQPPAPVAPMPSAMPRYQGDIAPMPDAQPAQKFQPQNPKPMPKPRSPFRMDAPTQRRRMY